MDELETLVHSEEVNSYRTWRCPGWVSRKPGWAGSVEPGDGFITVF